MTPLYQLLLLIMALIMVGIASWAWYTLLTMGESESASNEGKVTCKFCGHIHDAWQTRCPRCFTHREQTWFGEED